jgi:hypothetical protein
MKLQTNIFYISLLELVPKNVKPTTSVEAEDEEEEWDVEEVLDSQIIDR